MSTHVGFTRLVEKRVGRGCNLAANVMWFAATTGTVFTLHRWMTYVIWQYPADCANERYLIMVLGCRWCGTLRHKTEGRQDFVSMLTGYITLHYIKYNSTVDIYNRISMSKLVTWGYGPKKGFFPRSSKQKADSFCVRGDESLLRALTSVGIISYYFLFMFFFFARVRFVWITTMRDAFTILHCA